MEVCDYCTREINQEDLPQGSMVTIGDEDYYRCEYCTGAFGSIRYNTIGKSSDGQMPPLQRLGYSPDVAKRLIAIREAVLHNDMDKAFHHTYMIASPNADKYSDTVWKEMEEQAKLSKLEL